MPYPRRLKPRKLANLTEPPDQRPDRGEPAAPGWDAIDAQLHRWYGAAEPWHVGYVPPAAFSHNLQGCSAYAADWHWHYVTYGLSELYEPGPDDDPAFSGWGFELTLRVSRGREGEPPGWAFQMLNEMAKLVRGNLVLLEPGSTIDLQGPITGDPTLSDAPWSGLTAFAVTLDPQLGVIATPHGEVAFLQLVGVTAAEKERMQSSSRAAVLAELAGGSPLLITDPARAG